MMVRGGGEIGEKGIRRPIPVERYEGTWEKAEVTILWDKLFGNKYYET